MSWAKATTAPLSAYAKDSYRFLRRVGTCLSRSDNVLQLGLCYSSGIVFNSDCLLYLVQGDVD